MKGTDGVKGWFAERGQAVAGLGLKEYLFHVMGGKKGQVIGIFFSKNAFTCIMSIWCRFEKVVSLFIMAISSTSPL